MTKAASESNPAGPGHNTIELSEAERISSLIRTLKDIEGEIEIKDASVSNIRTYRKRLVGLKFTPGQIDYALKLRKNEIADEVSSHRARIEIAKMLGHEIGLQPDMFDQPDRTPDVEKAKKAGFIAGSEGKTCSSPYGTGSPQEQEWIKGWHDGQSTITSAFKKLEAKEAAEAESEGSEEGKA